MEKHEYKKLINEKLWEQIDNFYGDFDKKAAPYIAKIDLPAPEKWIQFTVDRFDTARQSHETTLPHYGPDENLIATLNSNLGRNEHNSFELNYGLNDEDNQQLVELIGYDNIDKMGLEREGLLVRLIVNTPGHGVAWHHDAANSYFIKFPGFAKDLSQLARLWFSVVPWQNGQVFQIGSSILHGWEAGDVWQIPWGVPHASSNFGYHMKYTVSLTGKLKSA